MLPYSFAGFFLIIVVAFARGTKDKYEDFCFAASLPIMLILLPRFGLLTAWLRPITLDTTLQAIDVALGLDGFALTRFVDRMWLYSILPIVYDALPLIIAVAWSYERPRFLMREVLLGAALAFPFYLSIPACGPSHAFPDWPYSATRVVSAIPVFPRNCMPSMHFAWAMLLALSARNRIWRSLLWIFVALTGIATVVSGEHYVVDVLAAIPFTFAVQWIARLGHAAGRSISQRSAEAIPEEASPE
jgi:membrane-associated phospholipid phosphatase